MTASTHPDARLFQLYDQLVLARAAIDALGDQRITLAGERRTEREWIRALDRSSQIERRIASIKPFTEEGWKTIAQAARLNAYRCHDEILASAGAQDIAWAVVVHVAGCVPPV